MNKIFPSTLYSQDMERSVRVYNQDHEDEALSLLRRHSWGEHVPDEEWSELNRRFPFIWKTVPKPSTPARKTTLLDSPIEHSFWKAHQRLKLRPLVGLVRQYKVGPYRLDFALPRQMIGIELDGHRTHSSTAAIAADRRRQRHLESLGWYIIRFGGQEVFQDAEDCVKQAAQLATRHRRHR